MTFLSVLWFVLIFVLIIGYFVLDGFDLGVGVLYPWLGRNEEEKAILRQSIGPVWDGNEVWLLTAVGALFAAFAPAYATTFSGFYLAIMLVLFGLILRAVSLELRAQDFAKRGIWDACFFIGSLLPALLFGVAVGNVIMGLPLDANGDYLGTFFDLLNPFSLVCGFVGLFQMCAHGCAWVAVKTEGELHDRAVMMRSRAQLLTLIAFSIATLLPTPAPYGGQPFFILCVLLALVPVGSLLLGLLNKKLGDLPAFLSSCVTCVALAALFGASLFPFLVPSTIFGTSITIASAAGSEVGLGAMAIIACIGVPLVLVYHFIIYRKFAGKIKPEDVHY